METTSIQINFVAAAALFFGLLPTASAQNSLVMPVTNGLVCWYDASAAQTNASGTVTTWVDLSGGAHNATSGGGTPTQALNDINSRPAVHFRGGNTYLNCNPQGGMFTKEQYVVVRSPNATWNGSGSFLGRASQDFLSVRVGSYNMAQGTTGFWQDHYPIAVSRNGTAMPGAPFALTTITSYMILKITVDQPDPGNIANYPNYQIGKNETLGTMDFDVSEIIGFSSPLSSGDEALVGAYLAKKYGLTTAYPAATFTSTALALTGGSTPAAVGSALTFTATVAGVAPSGSVTFYDGAASIGAGTVNSSAQAILTTSSLAVGVHNITARYPGDSGNLASVSAILTVQIANPADILSFTFLGLASATITGTAISATVPYATDVTVLAPTYTTLPGATGVPASGTVRNFTSPQTYVINGSKTYSVTVTRIPASNAKDILTCNFGTLGTATFDGTNFVLTVAPSQSRTLAPTFTISPLATLSPPSGSINDFTNPVTYTVTAEDGSTKAYAVVVQTYDSWPYHGSLFILTTPESANLPASASETNFPLLVRFTAGNFNFAQAQSDGRDIRFGTVAGAPLAYELEQWDATNGQAAVWVKIPVITGNARQEIRMHWGKTGVVSESSGRAVFNAANGFASVLHMNETVSDAAGTVTLADTGTTLATGMIFKGRNFTAGQGIASATNITAYPSGANPNSTEAWIRPVAATANVLGWGTDLGWGRVLIQLVKPVFDGPPSMNVDCYSGGGTVAGSSPIALSNWVHVAHTYKSGQATLYVNGVPDGTNTSGTMNLPSPLSLSLGGWDGAYNYAGDLDEVRISSVTRSANWIRLEYENQKPLQTLAGSLVQDGSAFSVTPAAVTMNEGTATNLIAQAGGAQKVYWILKQNGQETIMAVDQLTYTLAVGRVTGDQSFVLQFKAIYATGVQTNDIPVTVKDTIPDPVYTLTAPATWDGRQTVNITPNISNWSALQAAAVTNLNYNWTVTGLAVTQTITNGTVTLLLSQGSGPLTVTLVLDNGGALVTKTTIIAVQEPVPDPWVVRTPDANDKPVSGQFFARDDTGYGTIFYNGTLSQTATNVFLKVYTNGPSGDVLYTNLSQTLPGNKVYAFSARIPAGLLTYKVQFGYINAGVSTVIDTVTNLVCGDAYLIDGQSNAVADNYYGDTTSPLVYYTNPWIRSYGQMGGGTGGGWGNATSCSTVSGSSTYMIGVWGMNVATNLLADYQMPICIINGAVGGTMIKQHQPNPANHYDQGDGTYAIYANLITRVAGAKLTHGIRGVMWHQGEANANNWENDADWDYLFYQQFFLDMSAAWRQDMPNLRHYYLFQIFPAGCASGARSCQLREVQRDLPRLYSSMYVMPTLAFSTGANCHFDIADYCKMGQSLVPLLERDNYGLVPTTDITAPDLKQAYFTSTNKNEIALVFGQSVAWSPAATANFFLDAVGGKVTSGSASGNVIKLQVTGASTSQTIDYVVDTSWNYNTPNLIYGSNGVAALTFYGVPIAASGALTANLNTLPATGLTTNSAVLNALLACPGTNYAISVYWNTVNGGTNAALWTNSAFVGSWSNVASTSLSYPITGLTPNTLYYVTFHATNAVSDLWAANVLSFTTLAPPSAPGVDNAAGAVNPSAGVAQLRATLTNGPADVRFYWGPADGGTNGSWANTNLLAGAASGLVSANANNLLYGLTYYYRACASNQYGMAWAPATATFTTLKPVAPAPVQIPYASIVEVAASSAYSGYPATNAFNGNGLSGDGSTHGTTGNWFSSGAQSVNNQWLKVRFDQSYVLDHLRVWAFNFLSGAGACVTNADVCVLDNATDPAGNVNLGGGPFRTNGWSLLLAQQPFTPNPSSGSGPEASTDPNISLGGVTARQLSLKINNVVSGGYAGFAEVQIYRTPPVISLASSAATGVTATSAGLNATLACTGSVYSVCACWSTVNGGTNAGLWTNSAYVGSWTNAASTNLSFTATGLTPSTPYYFTFYATNAVDTLWAANVQGFTTLASVGPPTPVLPVGGVTVSNGVPSFSFTAAAGCQYRLDYKNALTDSVWSLGAWRTNTTGNPLSMTLSDLSALGWPQRFYRLEAANP